MDNLNDSPATAEVQVPASTEASQVTSPAEVTQNGQAEGKPTPEEVTFAKRFDPKSLPPQLQESYKNMLRDYTEKTTNIAERVKSETAKAVESFKQKAELYDQIASQEEFVKQWNDYARKSGQPTGEEQGQNPIEKKVQEIEMRLKSAETLEVINAFADAKDEKGNKLHPDFDKLSNFKIGTHSTSGEYDLLRAAIELAPGDTPQEKIANGYKQASDLYKAIYEEGRKAGMGRIQDKARNSSLSPSATNAGNSAPTRPKNALEALQFARQGLAVAG